MSAVERLLERSQESSARATVVVVCVLTGLAVAIDLLTPAWFEAGLFYLPAIVLAAWRLPFSAAAGVALLAVCPRLFDRGPHPPAVGAPAGAALWLAVAWLGTYLILALLAASLRSSVEGGRRLANTDALTGLANRSAAMGRIEAELNRSSRGRHRAKVGPPPAVVYVDCDDFKQVNDSRGHLEGDRLLKTIAQTLQWNTRSYDLAARMGGDEFLLLLPETSAEQARLVVERIRTSLLGAMQSGGWNVTFSIGVATFGVLPSSAKELIRAADELMYSVKRAGKDGVEYGAFGVESLEQ